MTPTYKHRDIRFSVPVKAPAERVWRCLTSARELCAWWVERAETDARNGGRLRLVWPPTADESAREARGFFVDLDPGRKAAWMWAPAGRGVPPLVTFFLQPRRGGCEITLLHAGFSAAAAGDKRFAVWQRFWEDCLAKLLVYAERGESSKTERLTLADLDRKKRVRTARPGVLLSR